MAMASTLAAPNETKSTFVRTTKDGRQIRYSLQVIQQPERARACGSGAKSSADRRPVDPPPIVELRVFENDMENTAAYNANFFLHCSLENARNIAPGRAQTAAPSFPVLTGTPVAGMAYLDRPAPAGYFIFPDLSVRHEGKYRLSFSLFENLSEVKDLDPEDPHVIYDGNHFVTHRAEVKSMPFTVFSAKKFPGLSESTALSRMVAEQGCRVRIRRDVRMRRRENKSSKDWDEFDEEGGEYNQTRRTATPDIYGNLPDGRPRSISNASNTSLVPPRRPSVDDMAQTYPAPSHYQEMPPPQSTAYPPMPQYASDQHYQNPYAAPQPAPMMQPPSGPYSHSAHPHHPPHNAYHSPPTLHASQPYSYSNYQQPHYEPAREPAHEYAHSTHSSHFGHSAHSSHSAPSMEYRRTSITQPPSYPASSATVPPYTPVEPYRPHQVSQSHPAMHTSPTAPPASGSTHTSPRHSLPHIKSLQAPLSLDKSEPPSPLYQSPPSALSSSNMSVHSDSADHSYPPPNFTSAGLPSGGAGTKRSFSSTFDTRHVTERLTGGARPNPSGAGYSYDRCDSPDMEEPMDRSAMSYRRADGTQRQRHVPELGF